MKPKCVLIVFGLLTTALLGTTPARAEGEGLANGAVSHRVLDEVVVMARRREERLQEVPVAVTAISAERLQEAGISKLEDVRFLTPGLQIQPGVYGTNIPSFLIRGQKQAESLLTLDQAVATYVDEVPLARPNGSNLGLFDIQSVQVLKGPQGTLFGRNTTGGAILLQSRRPTDEFEGEIAGTIGNFDHRQATAIVNLPFSEILKMRAGVQWTHRDGYSTNVATSRDANDEDSYAWRLSALFDFGDFENLTIWSGAEANNNTFAIVLQRIGSSPALDPVATQSALDRQASLSFYDFAGDLSPSRNDLRTQLLSNVTTYQLGSIKIKNIFGYRKVFTDVSYEVDATDLTTIDGLPIFQAFTRQDTQQRSEELQLSGSSFSDRLNWVAGAFYFEEEGSDGQQTVLGVNRLSQFVGGDARNVSKSLYAQIELNLTPRVVMTLGGRYTEDTRYLTSRGKISGLILPNGSVLRRPDLYPDFQIPAVACRNTAYGGTLANGCVGGEQHVEHSEPTYTAGLSWQPNDDLLLYFTHRRGYRSGGLNLRSVSPSTIRFQPETVKDYEIGLKADWRLGGIALRSNLAVYHQDYEDIQRTVFAAVFPNTAVSSGNINAAAATIQGAELELAAAVTDRIEFSGFVSVTDASYDDFLLRLTAGTPPNPALPPIVLDQSGEAFAGTPKTQWGVTTRVILPLDVEGEVAFQAQYYRQTGFQWTDVSEPGASTEGYGLLDMRLNWKHLFHDVVDASLWVKNVLDKEYTTSGLSTGFTFGTQGYFPGNPRTYGVDLRVQF